MFKTGDIVRHRDGPTALSKLISPHPGGWLAEHCLGGTLFVSEIRWATEQDILVAASSQFAASWLKARAGVRNAISSDN